MCGDHVEEFLCVCSCRERSIALSPFVLIRISVVANTTNDKTRESIHQSSSFHLEAQNAILLGELIPEFLVFYDPVARGNQAVVDLAGLFPGLSVSALQEYHPMYLDNQM